jgi:dTDP-4-dehydrorhamnose reductase
VTRRVAITGATGQLGRELVRAFRAAGDEVAELTRPRFDLDNVDASATLLGDLRPDVLINAAAWTDVDGCAREPERAMRLNGDAPARLAALARPWQPLFVQMSTNEVFDGIAQRPYAEDSPAAPINPYGESKLAAERGVASATPTHLLIRTAWLFGPDGRNFVSKILAAAERARDRGETLRVVEDEWGNPTWTPALADAIVNAVSRAPQAGIRILHLAGSPAATRHAWAARALERMEHAPKLTTMALADYRRPSRVPPRAVLGTALARSLGIRPIDWQDATNRYVAKLSIARASA